MISELLTPTAYQNYGHKLEDGVIVEIDSVFTGDAVHTILEFENGAVYSVVTNHNSKASYCARMVDGRNPSSQDDTSNRLPCDGWNRERHFTNGYLGLYRICEESDNELDYAMVLCEDCLKAALFDHPVKRI